MERHGNYIHYTAHEQKEFGVPEFMTAEAAALYAEASREVVDELVGSAASPKHDVFVLEERQSLTMCKYARDLSVFILKIETCVPELVAEDQSEAGA